MAAGPRAPARLAGWWGNDPSVRFRMDATAPFVPQPGADGWQLSNPPILQLAALRGSLAVFERAGPDALFAKSAALTAFALRLLDALAARLEAKSADRGCAGDAGGQARERQGGAAGGRLPRMPPLQVITPRDPAHRGAQLSVRLAPTAPDKFAAAAAAQTEAAAGLDRAERLQRLLASCHGVEVDYRRPNVLRFGLVPLYTRFADVVFVVRALEAGLAQLDAELAAGGARE